MPATPPADFDLAAFSEAGYSLAPRLVYLTVGSLFLVVVGGIAATIVLQTHPLERGLPALAFVLGIGAVIVGSQFWGAFIGGGRGATSARLTEDGLELAYPSRGVRRIPWGSPAFRLSIFDGRREGNAVAPTDLWLKLPWLPVTYIPVEFLAALSATAQRRGLQIRFRTAAVRGRGSIRRIDVFPAK
jgi:hypothetical protein